MTLQETPTADDVVIPYVIARLAEHEIKPGQLECHNEFCVVIQSGCGTSDLMFVDLYRFFVKKMAEFPSPVAARRHAATLDSIARCFWLGHSLSGCSYGNIESQSREIHEANDQGFPGFIQEAFAERHIRYDESQPNESFSRLLAVSKLDDLELVFWGFNYFLELTNTLSDVCMARQQRIKLANSLDGWLDNDPTRNESMSGQCFDDETLDHAAFQESKNTFKSLLSKLSKR